MKLIVGLGNPGAAYAQTRHNAGFMAVDCLAGLIGAGSEKTKCRALVRDGADGGCRVLLAKPQTYMNLSGNPLWELLNFYKDRISALIIVHDDLDLSLGRIRFRSDGGTGGHKGLASIAARLGSNSFDRLKIGVGRPPAYMATEDYVLQSFAEEEKALLLSVLQKSAEGLRLWMAQDIAQAMNRYNSVDLCPAEAKTRPE